MIYSPTRDVSLPPHSISDIDKNADVFKSGGIEAVRCMRGMTRSVADSQVL